MIDRHLVVLQASKFLRDRSADGVRIGEVSRAVGVSERTLRNAFHKEHGLSPKQYELRERLQAAREALCDVTTAHTVTDVASRHGFFELGRFASRYKHTFGESPSETLKARRRRPDAG
jgi:transcriptional regulator GlxA family with amidase domain